MNCPKVSVVVPNFNHAGLLRRRLDSVYGQTHQDLEVILLDDASTDGSMEILESYADRYPDRTRLLSNETNTGSPFAQWAKGIREARADLVWIAEADDYADTGLLEKLVAAFEDPQVVLAFAKPVYVDAQGVPGRFQFADYVGANCVSRWDAPYVVEGFREVHESMGIRNTIPNASAAMFRRTAAEPHIGDPLWQKTKVCGDWCLYLRLLAQGHSAYVGEAGAYYTFHNGNWSFRQSRAEGYLAEHAMAIAIIRALFPETPPETLRRNFDCLFFHLQWISGEERPTAAEDWQAVEYSRLWEQEDKLVAALAEIRAKSEHLDALEHELHAQRDKWAKCSSELAAVLDSTSWRLTQPLRGSIDAIRGIFRGTDQTRQGK